MRRKSGARERWGEAEARALLTSWERSGLTLSAFAKGRGYGPERLRRWQQKLGIQRQAPAPRLVPVEITRALSRSTGNERIEVVLPRGVRLITDAHTDPQIVARLVAALESSGC